KVTTTVAEGSTWIAPFVGTIEATAGGERSTVWKRVSYARGIGRPKISVTPVPSVRMTSCESGHVYSGLKVSVRPSALSERPHETPCPLAVRAETEPFGGWIGSDSVNTTGLPTGTPVAPSGGSTAKTETGLSSRTIEPRSAVLPLPARFWPGTSATPVVTGLLTKTENAPRGTPRAAKRPSPWACSVTAPRDGSSRRVTRAPAAGVAP